MGVQTFIAGISAQTRVQIRRRGGDEQFSINFPVVMTSKSDLP